MSEVRSWSLGNFGPQAAISVKRMNMALLCLIFFILSILTHRLSRGGAALEDTMKVTAKHYKWQSKLKTKKQ
jgi:hypothetical protein